MAFTMQKLPSRFPTWSQMLDSLGNPSPRDLGRILGLSERTVFNYKKADQAPRAVMLAVFWLTPWGDSALDTERENFIRVLQSLSSALKNENAGLRLRIARLEATGDFRSANDPVHSDQAPAITESLWESSRTQAAQYAARRHAAR